MKYIGENSFEFMDQVPDDHSCLAYSSEIKVRVETGKWPGYIPIDKKYNLEQKYSDKGVSMKQMHTRIHQLKSWLRTTYLSVNEKYIENYLDECSFRLNRSISQQTIFHNLISRMLFAQPFAYQMIKIRS